MPNISLSSRCNLHCPYCFAHETMGAGSGDITLENFDAALEFLTRTGPVNIGLIGGEPTLHPHFDEIVRRAVACENVAMLTVYTNGLLIEKHADALSLPKVTLLVNWNAPSELREGAFEQIERGVDKLIFNRGMGCRINLGLNLHGETMEYGYMLDLLKRYGFDKVRISLTVPEFPEGCGQNAIERFRACKPFLLKMFADMDAIGVLPYYDCNRPPWCIWSDEEKRWLRDLAARHGADECTLVDTESFCRPVIDVLPDLRAVRCFGMSAFEKVGIRDYADANDLAAHFMRRIDRPAYRIKAMPECENCHLRRTWLCCQGCMGYKMIEIEKMNAERGE